MLQKLSSFFWYDGSYHSVVVGGDATATYHLTKAKLIKGAFEDLEFSALESLESLKQELGKTAHLQLTIDNDKVLSKTVPWHEDSDKLLAEAFPGLNTSEFFYQITPWGSYGLVSIVRKDAVTSIVESFEKAGLKPLGISLGVGSIQPLSGLIDQDTILTSSKKLRLENDSLLGIESSDDHIDYSIEGTTIHSDYLLSVAGLFGYLNRSSISNLKEDTSNLLSDFKHRVFAKKGIVVGLAILLVLLVVNSILFNSYYTRLSQLQDQMALAQNQKEVLAQKNKRIEQKQRLVNSILQAGGSKASFYSNRIVASLPTSIKLDLLAYQPLSKAIRQGQPIEVHENRINIEGTSLDSAEFSIWMNDLQKLDFVEEVITYQYEQGRRSTSFGIQLNIFDETQS